MGYGGAGIRVPEAAKMEGVHPCGGFSPVINSCLQLCYSLAAPPASSPSSRLDSHVALLTLVCRWKPKPPRNRPQGFRLLGSCRWPWRRRSLSPAAHARDDLVVFAGRGVRARDAIGKLDRSALMGVSTSTIHLSSRDDRSSRGAADKKAKGGIVVGLNGLGQPAKVGPASPVVYMFIVVSFFSFSWGFRSFIYC